MLSPPGSPPQSAGVRVVCATTPSSLLGQSEGDDSVGSCVVPNTVLSLLMCIFVLLAWVATLAHGQSFSTVTTLAGNLTLTTGSTNGLGTAAMFNQPYGAAMDAVGAVAIVVSSILYAWDYQGCIGEVCV